MKLFKRGLVVATMAAASVALLGGSASAAITPNPYTFSSVDTGTFSTRTILGTSTCRISNISGSLSGTATGASGTVNGATISGCSGVILSASLTGPITVTVNSGAVTINVSGLLVRTAIGGNCLYAGTLTGTIARGSGTVTASSAGIPLVRTLSGTCTPSAQATLSVVTRASITW